MATPRASRLRNDELARKIVANGPGVLAGQNVAWKFGGLWSFSKQEQEGLETVRERVTKYLNLTNPTRPLCIAVFGPPGSGKSFAVKEIFEQLKRERREPLGWIELNLTQFDSTRELARAVVGPAEVRKHAGAYVPFIFFDEFDAALSGAPLGWLSWFLAPMNDGEFIVDGEHFELTKAVYIFAGGTATTMEQFGGHNRDGFRAAKGPDFVSRLQTYINVRGPNDATAQQLRRGLALWLALSALAKRTGEKRKRKLSKEILDMLLTVGRYRHGQRSVDAIVTMMDEQIAAPATLTPDALPPQFLLDMQVDRGPLDPQRIGGLLGLSGGGFPSTRREQRADMWRALAQEFWGLGATIAYGGRWRRGDLTRALVNAPQPHRLGREKTKEPRLEIHAMTAPPNPDNGVTVVMVPPASVPGVTGSIQKAADLFRMRWQSGARCRARILLSGKTVGYSGRMPGIIEEAMIAIALRQPIYVLGGFGDAAMLLGEYLGLSTSAHPRKESKTPASLQLDEVAHLFRPAGFEKLPLTREEALSYIASNAIGGPGWVDNGLSVEENRRLFGLSGRSATSRQEAVFLIRKGLLRAFDR